MKVALYARVSSDKQDVDLSISAQLRALTEYAARNGHQVVKEFVDEAESGRTVHRPVFQEMISLTRHKPPPLEAILVWKLSRFARNREDSIIYKSLLRKHGVQVISINEPVEDSPTGRMLEGIIEVLDEFYSANLAQDVTRGMREAASRGFWVGSRPPYGYRLVKVPDGSKQRNRLEPDPDKASIVNEMFHIAGLGAGVKEIAATLNARGIPSPKGRRWSKGLVHSVLTNEAYVGVMTWGVKGQLHGQEKLPPIRVENAWQPLVDREVFEAVGRNMASRAFKVLHPRRVHSPYLLSGLLKCDNCGASMMGQSAKSGKFHYYVCGTAFRQGRHLCNTKPIPQNQMEKLVLEKITSLMLKEEHLEELVRLTNEELVGSLHQLQSRTEHLQFQQAEVGKRLERLYEALETGKVGLEDLAPRIKELRQKRELLVRAENEAQQALDMSQVELVDREAVMGYVSQLGEVLKHGTITEQKTLLRSFIRSVEVRESQATIHYVLPLPPEKVDTEFGVLSIVNDGGR